MSLGPCSKRPSTLLPDSRPRPQSDPLRSSRNLMLPLRARKPSRQKRIPINLYHTLDLQARNQTPSSPRPQSLHPTDFASYLGLSQAFHFLLVQLFRDLVGDLGLQHCLRAGRFFEFGVVGELPDLFCGAAVDGVPAAGFDDEAEVAEESGLETGDVGAAAGDYDAGHAGGADVGGEGEECVVDELSEGLFVVVEVAEVVARG